MNAHALLTSQGWRGTGHSLHSTSDSIGLSKPLLVSQKQNNLGLGKKQHKTSDMWWMNAFDSSLKGLDTSKQGVVVQTMTSGGLDMVARGGGKYVGKSGLYASFVRGESLSGTITPEEREEVYGKGEGQKRKRDGESKEERRTRKAAKLAAVKESEKVSAGESSEGKESKEERRARKEAKKQAEKKFSTLPAAELDSSSRIVTPNEETKEERKARKAAKRASKVQEPITEVTEVENSEKVESKEERKERKRLKKLSEAERKSEESSEGSRKKKRGKD